MNQQNSQGSSTVIDMAAALRDKASKIEDRYKVYANGNFVGEISANEYLALKQAAKQDKRLYSAQAMNFVDTGFRLVSRIVLSVPENWFVLIVLIALIMPAEFNSTVSALVADPSAASSIFLTTLRWALAASVVTTALIAVVTGESFGQIDKFEERVQMAIRGKFNLPPMCKLYIDVARVLDGLPSSSSR